MKTACSWRMFGKNKILDVEKRRRCYWRNEIIDQPTLLKSQWYAYLSLSFLYTLLDLVFLYSSSTSFNVFILEKKLRIFQQIY